MIRAATALALVGAPVVLLAQAPDDFARGADIRLDGSGSIFRVTLPDDVYEAVTRADLGDIRVLNGAGDAVLHSLRQAPRPPDPQAEWRVVPSFPMSEARSGAAGRTQVRIGADGAVLEVTNDTGPGRTVAAYLLDTSALKDPIVALALSWDAPADVTFLTRVSVQRSDDLDTWRAVVPSAALAQLQRDTYTLVQSEIVLPAAGERAKYFRIAWPRELAAVSVTSVRVRPRAEAQREIRWKTLAAERVQAADGALYDTRGVLAIEYVDLEFADATDAAAVAVRSRPASSSSWIDRHTGVFYTLQESGTPLRSSPARIAPTTDRYWAVETTREGGWRADRAPRLKVGWHPHELLFLAQGAAPYTLVYGSGRVGAADAPVDELLASLTEAERTNRVRPATLGPSRTLGGDAARTAPPPVRRIALWAVLVVAVAALGFVAMRLFRDTAQAG